MILVRDMEKNEPNPEPNPARSTGDELRLVRAAIERAEAAGDADAVSDLLEHLSCIASDLDVEDED